MEATKHSSTNILNSVIQSTTDQCFTPNIQQIYDTSEQNQNHGQLVKNDDFQEKPCDFKVFGRFYSEL
jgi:hypothetical protein